MVPSLSGSQHDFFISFSVVVPVHMIFFSLIVWETSPTIFVLRSDADLNMLSLLQIQLLLQFDGSHKTREVLRISLLMRQIDTFVRHFARLALHPVPFLCFNVHFVSLYFVAKSFRFGPNQLQESILVFRRNLKTLVWNLDPTGFLFWFWDDVANFLRWLLEIIVRCWLALPGEDLSMSTRLRSKFLLMGLSLSISFNLLSPQSRLLQLHRHFIFDEFLQFSIWLRFFYHPPHCFSYYFYNVLFHCIWHRFVHFFEVFLSFLPQCFKESLE